MEEIKQKLVDKSIEAFIMGLEIYNKPTIKYLNIGLKVLASSYVMLGNSC